jgi:hypothetical protein
MRHLILTAALAPVLLLAGTIAAMATGDAAGIRIAGKAFMLALVKGDVDAADSVAHLTKRESPFLQAMAINLAGEAKLATAMEKRFGTSAGRFSPRQVGAVVENAKIELNGTTAELGRAGDDTLPMRKVGAVWKVDVVELAARHHSPLTALPVAEARAEALRVVIAGVEAGRYGSAARAAQDLNARYALVKKDVERRAHASTAE